MSYVIRHTDYINCCYSGKNYKEGDTPIAKVSPHAKDWKVFQSEHNARMTLRGIHYMSTTKMIDKNHKRPPFEYKWVVEKYVDNVSITSTQ